MLRRVATWVRDHPDELFYALLVVALPVIVFGLADYTWFFRDDWVFIAERELSFEDVFEPHNAHWSTVPVLVFRLLYAVFGLHSYVPYLGVVVVAHLAVVALLRTIMVRAGVGPWVANAFAAALVFFGPGREDIIWAFQIGFTGAIAFILAQLVLADHDGPVGPRDGIALLLGLLGLMSSGSAAPLVVVVGLALLVRRGWRRAALQTAPLAAAYLAYGALADPATQAAADFGPRVALDWVWHGLRAGFDGIGGYRPVSLALVVLLVVGVAVHVLAPGADDDRSWWERVRAVAVPLALFVGVVAFIVAAARSRAAQGPEGAEARRYVYFYAVGTLPILAVAASALVRRWRLAAPVVVLVLVAVPANIDSFDTPPFGPGYHQTRRDVLLAVLAVPDSGRVDGDMRPIPDVFMGDGVTLDFLRHARDTGALPTPPATVPPVLRNELQVRLAVEQVRHGSMLFCAPVGVSELRTTLDEGEALGLTGQVEVLLVRDGRPVERGAVYNRIDGNHLVGTGTGVELFFRTVGPAAELPLCIPP